MRCGSCGDRFELSVRDEYGYRKAGKPLRCATCRHPARSMSNAEREHYVRWWREESGLAEHELHEIVEGLTVG